MQFTDHVIRKLREYFSKDNNGKIVHKMEIRESHLRIWCRMEGYIPSDKIHDSNSFLILESVWKRKELQPVLKLADTVSL